MVQVHRLSPNGRVTYTAVSTVLKTVGVVKGLGVGTSLCRQRNGDEFMKKYERKQTIKEWEIEKGIEIKNPRGFWGKKSQIYNKLYTERLFRKCARLSEIRCKTEKGLSFLEG